MKIVKLEPWEEVVGILEEYEPGLNSCNLILFIPSLGKRLSITVFNTLARWNHKEIANMISNKIGILRCELDNRTNYLIRQFESEGE